ncbi:MAG: alpha-hydroxy acid oxidase [Pseudorhodoplanes sp.]
MTRLERCYSIEDLRKAARKRLPKGVFEYMDRGSEDEVALANNRAAFERIKLRSRFMVDLTKRDFGTTLFGKTLKLPLVIAPTGWAGFCWYQGEVALAKAAASAGIPFTLGSTSIASMDAVAKESGGPLWFQLYMWDETELCYEMVGRARDLGYEALVVTIDSALGRSREHNDRNDFVVPFRMTWRNTTDMLRHPRWLAGTMFRYLAAGGYPRHANHPPQYQAIFGKAAMTMPRTHAAMTWDDVARLRKFWPRTLIVKSVMTAEEARLAVEHGADGIVVSNHGGRAMDSAPATIDVLPEIADAVGSRTTVMLDSGIRRGSDIAKALALGAKAVLIGRATLYGSAVGGEAGATRALTILTTEFEKTMGYIGCRTIAEVGPDILQRRARERQE